MIYVTPREGHPDLEAWGIDVPKLIHHRPEPLAFVQFDETGVSVSFPESIWQAAEMLRAAGQRVPETAMVAPDDVYSIFVKLHGPLH